MIALCCHHKCTWESVANRSFFEKIGIKDEREFAILCKLSSWAVDGQTDENEAIKKKVGNNTEKSYQRVLDENEMKSREYFLNATWEDRRKIGRMCKRIIDYARILYLESIGYEASLVNYIQEDTTPENVLLVATRKKTHNI